MKPIRPLGAVVVCATLALSRLAAAQTAPAIPESIMTPDKVESSINVEQRGAVMRDRLKCKMS